MKSMHVNSVYLNWLLLFLCSCPSSYPARQGNSWLKALSRCICESQFPRVKGALLSVEMDMISYTPPQSSNYWIFYATTLLTQCMWFYAAAESIHLYLSILLLKWFIFNFVIFASIELRNWIDEQSSNFIEREEKQRKGNVID